MNYGKTLTASQPGRTLGRPLGLTEASRLLNVAKLTCMSNLVKSMAATQLALCPSSAGIENEVDVGKR